MEKSEIPEVIIFWRSAVPDRSGEISRFYYGRAYDPDCWTKDVNLIVINYQTQEIILEQYPKGADFELYMKALAWIQERKERKKPDVVGV